MHFALYTSDTLETSSIHNAHMHVSPSPTPTHTNTHTHTVHRAQSTGLSKSEDKMKGKGSSLSHSLFDNDSMDDSEDLFSPKLTKPEQVG